MPDDTPAAPAGSDPALGFSITSNIHGSAQIVVQAFIERDAEPKAIDDLLDKVMARLDRQSAKYMIKDLKKKRELEALQYEDQKRKADELPQKYADEFHATESKRSNGRQREYTPSPQHAAAMENAQKTVAAMKQNIERFDVNIAELEALAQ